MRRHYEQKPCAANRLTTWAVLDAFSGATTMRKLRGYSHGLPLRSGWIADGHFCFGALSLRSIRANRNGGRHGPAAGGEHRRCPKASAPFRRQDALGIQNVSTSSSSPRARLTPTPKRSPSAASIDRRQHHDRYLYRRHADPDPQSRLQLEQHPATILDLDRVEVLRGPQARCSALF